LSLETGLTDATLLVFDKLMGSLSRKAERRSQEKAAKSAHDLQEKLRALTGACTAMIRARENRDDPFIAIERQMKMGWSQFVTFVTETEAIVAPDKTDPKVEVLRRYATVRKIAPAFLEAFTFKATPSAKPIIDALDVLKALYRTGQRSLPAKPPIRFIRRVWRPFVIQGGEIDRKAYELCAFFELRLRAGDRSRVRPLPPVRLPLRSAHGRDDQRGPIAACSAARLGAHRADRRLRLEHCRSTAGRYAQTAAAAAIPTGGLSSGNVPDVVQSEHFRAVTPICV